MVEETPDRRRVDGWAEYQRLVLAELERHDQLIGNLVEKLNAINIQLALIAEDIKHGKDLIKRVQSLENTDVADNAIKKYKKWIIGIGVTVIVALIVPIIKLVFLPGHPK